MSLAGTAGLGEASHFRRIPRANHAPRLIAANAMLPVFLVLLLLFACCGGQAARAEPPAGDAPRIEWEVKNRFRLFRSERDFQRHAAAYRADGVLAAERRLERDTGGRGWARTMVGSLCVDGAGNLNETCTRDSVAENYLAPDDHRIGAVLANAPADATCAWSFDDGERPPQQITLACEEEVTLRVRYGRTTPAQFRIARSDGASDS